VKRTAGFFLALGEGKMNCLLVCLAPLEYIPDRWVSDVRELLEPNENIPNKHF